MFSRIKRGWLQFRRPGFVTIARWGQLTSRPQVSVSVMSERGIQSVYTFDSNEQGEASATMYGRSLAHISGLLLVDQREITSAEPET